MCVSGRAGMAKLHGELVPLAVLVNWNTSTSMPKTSLRVAASTKKGVMPSDRAERCSASVSSPSCTTAMRSLWVFRYSNGSREPLVSPLNGFWDGRETAPSPQQSHVECRYRAGRYLPSGPSPICVPSGRRGARRGVRT